MFMIMFAIFLYAFFIYGVFEFFRKTYKAFGKKVKEQTIKIIADKEELEYIVRILKADFSNIVIILNEEDEEVYNIINKLAKDINIEIKTLKELSKIEKS